MAIKEKSRCTQFCLALAAVNLGLVLVAWFFSSRTCNTQPTPLASVHSFEPLSTDVDWVAQPERLGHIRRAPPPADEPAPPSLLKLVESYREKFSGPQPIGNDCRNDTSYVYVHWLVKKSGAGNRLPSSVTGAAIALMTGRRLILPTLSKKLFSPTIPVCYHDPTFGGSDETSGWSPADFPEAGKIDWDANLGLVTRVGICSDPKLPIWIGSLDYDLPYLSLNPECAALIKELAPDDGAYFYHIAKHLFPLAPALQTRVDSFAAQNFRKFNIGLHIRAKRAIIGEGAIQPNVFCFQARQLMLASGYALEDTFVFVASDWDVARTETFACLPKGTHANTTSVPVFGIQAVSSADDDAIVDMALLSRANELIGSHASTYTYCAAGIGGLRPWAVWNRIFPEGERSVRDPWAVHIPTTEPCTWAWPKALKRADTAQLALLQSHPLHHYYDSCGVVKF